MVLVTGATGFIGGHLARVLLEQGRPVRCLVRPSSNTQHLTSLEVEQVMGDLTDAASLRRAVAGCELVFHCAADYRLFASRPAELYRNNVEGTSLLLRVCSEQAVPRVVYTSSVGALGLHPLGEPADEETPVSLAQMVGHYKRSKFLAEQEAMTWARRGLNVVVVNPSTPVGELDVKPTPTGQMIVDFLAGRIPAYVTGGLNLVDVRDVAWGHVVAAERGRCGQRYILGNANLSLKELFERLARLSGRRAPRWRLPHGLSLAAAAASTAWARVRKGQPRVPWEGARMSRKKMFFDSRKAIAELALPQTPIDEALGRAIHWFSQHGYVR